MCVFMCSHRDQAVVVVEDKERLLMELQKKVASLERRLQGDLSQDEHLQELLQEVNTASESSAGNLITTFTFVHFLLFSNFSSMFVFKYIWPKNWRISRQKRAHVDNDNICCLCNLEYYLIEIILFYPDCIFIHSKIYVSAINCSCR